MWIAHRVAAAPYQSFAVFRDTERLESAIIDLCMSGLDRTEFSLVARDGALQDRLRRAYTVLNDTTEIAPSADCSTLAGKGFAVGLLTYGSALAASIGMVLHGAPAATILAGAVVGGGFGAFAGAVLRSEEHTSALQSLMRTSYAVFC